MTSGASWNWSRRWHNGPGAVWKCPPDAADLASRHRLARLVRSPRVHSWRFVMPTNRSLTICGLQVRGVNVPMRRPLATGAGTLDTAPLVLVDLATHEGVTGSSYIFCYTP